MREVPAEVRRFRLTAPETKTGLWACRLDGRRGKRPVQVVCRGETVETAWNAAVEAFVKELGSLN